MAGNKENMRQAMKELLGLVGVGSEEKQDEVDLEEARQEVADTMDKQFFQSSAASEMGGVGQPFLSDPMRGAGEDDLPEAAPFIRPGATVISAGTSLFGDLRAEGDVEVLGKLKGNLEATGKPGHLVEYDSTDKIFSAPSQQATEDYISGRFG